MATTRSRWMAGMAAVAWWTAVAGGALALAGCSSSEPATSANNNDLPAAEWRQIPRGEREALRRHRDTLNSAAIDKLLPALDLAKLGVTVENYPRVDGSTSTIPMAVVVACALCDYRWEWIAGDIGNRNDGAIYVLDGGLDSVSRVGEGEQHPVNRLTAHSNTHQAYVNLIERTKDLILVAREPSSDERAKAAQLGVTLDVRPVARDAFVFIVNGENPVRNLTLDQVRSIYRHEITNWRTVGGPDAKIFPYRRQPNSGSEELFEKLVLPNPPPINFTHDLIELSMAGPFLKLLEHREGIAYSVFFYREFQAPIERSAIASLAIDGVFPTTETITDQLYPLTADVFVVIRADTPANSRARQLRDWLLGPVGQLVVKASGYVPIGPVADIAPPPAQSDSE